MAAARKRKKTPPKRATRSLLAARPSLPVVHLPALEPHHVDIFGLGLIALGVLLGGALTAAVSGIARNYLVVWNPFDPAVFAGAVGVLLVAALFATLPSVLRARAIQPMTALRHE